MKWEFAILGFKVRLTVLRLILLAIVALGFVVAVLRFWKGLGAVTALNDQFPWGLWIGFDVVTGVALAAGAFSTAAAVYVFNLEKFRPILRPAILTGFLGYLMVIIGLLFDLGRPHLIWHPVIMWQHRSVMFEVAWCVMLYTTVLFLEFSPVLLERFGFKKAVKVIHSLTMPLVIVGVIFSTLHQSSLGSLFLIVPGKLHPLWYSSLLPVFFFISAVGVGLSMVIVESFLAAWAFKKAPEMDILPSLAKAIPVVLGIYFVARIFDMSVRGTLLQAFDGSFESKMFLAEILLGVVLPAVFLSIRRIRTSPAGLFAAAAIAVIGIVFNRLNVAITGMISSASAPYFPTWMELSITAAIVSFGVLAYAFIAENFPVLPFEEHAHGGAGELEHKGSLAGTGK
ncbi:MAG: NrfD/PsrC family molybdoenzyme membrane anchor subunit [Syntrophothermus sp.]